MASEGFYRSAAKAAWVAPLIAMFVSYANKSAASTAQEPKVQLVGAAICTVLILIGFICGVVALRGTIRHRRASILIPALIGVGFNGLMILEC